MDRWGGYESLAAEDNAEKRAHQPRGFKNVLLFLSISAVSLLVISYSCNANIAFVVDCLDFRASDHNEDSSESAHIDMSPTALSLVHPDTNQYIYPSNNPLYEQLKTAVFSQQNSSSLLRRTAEFPVLSLDKTSISIHQPVTLSWTLGKDAEGLPLVKNDDVMTLHCPANEHASNFREAATMRQIRATSQKHAPSSGDQEWHIPSFPILRHDSCQFRLWHSLPENNFHLLATSVALMTPDSKRTPTGLHLAWTNITSEIIVQFTTGDSGKPIAVYGINGTDTKVEGTSHTYGAGDMCQEPANITEVGKFIAPGMLHTVKLSNLKPNINYQYKVGLASGQGTVWSDIYVFHSAPLKGDTTPFSFVVYGDQGCPADGWGEGGVQTAAMATREVERTFLPIRHVHHFGDLSYARGAAHIWDDWFHMIAPFAARVPLMVGVGNHEYDHTTGGEDKKDPSGLNSSHGFMPAWGNMGDDSGGECGIPTSQRFTMPDNGNGVFWYSHEYGTVHTTMISSEHDLSRGSPQYQWLEADLKAINRSTTPWVILEAHRPLYDSQENWQDNLVGIGMRYEIEDLLYKYKVDVSLAGHYHAYLRTCDGLYRSKCNNGGPVYMTVGTAGASLDHHTLYPQVWTEYFETEEYGYGRFTVTNRTHLYWEFVRAGTADDPYAGTISDEVWIIRSDDRSYESES